METKRIDKPGFQISIDSKIIIKQKKDKTWVSRGGYKLDEALNTFRLDCKNIIALDIGSSTGGFTEVLLKRGAKNIYSVDVGYGQLDWKIRNCSKVMVMEKTNARYLDNTKIKHRLDAVVCDASFISLKKILPASLHLLKNQGWLVALIKPQFEAGKKMVGKGGIVKNESVHKSVIDDIKNWLTIDMKFEVKGVIESPILGSKGNKEFLICAYK